MATFLVLYLAIISSKPSWPISTINLKSQENQKDQKESHREESQDMNDYPFALK